MLASSYEWQAPVSCEGRRTESEVAEENAGEQDHEENGDSEKDLAPGVLVGKRRGQQSHETGEGSRVHLGSEASVKCRRDKFSDNTRRQNRRGDVYWKEQGIQKTDDVPSSNCRRIRIDLDGKGGERSESNK